MLNPHLPLSAHSLNALSHQIQAEGVKCIFRETEFNDTMVRQYFSDKGVKVAELDPLGARIPAGVDAYEKIMVQLGHTFQSCLAQ
jgi:zinc transport system substrate-binding protein